MQTTLIISLLAVIFLLIVIIAILGIAISKQSNNTDYTTLLGSNESIKQKIFENNQNLTKELGEQFQSNRLELTQNQNAQRQELFGIMQTMNSQVEKMGEKNAEFNEKLVVAISNNLTQIQQSNEKKLEEMRSTVNEKLDATLTQRLNSSFKNVSEQLENVYKSLGEMKALSSGVTDNVTSLNRVLTNVKARGTWAEVQLENILDQSIPSMYDKNVMTNPKNKNIVEFAVKIPSSDEVGKIIYLPIDSKFPIEDYIRLCDAGDSGDKELVKKYKKSLEATVVAQAKQVKKYINEPVTTPFAIMYLATEGLYSEIISSKNAIVERCQNELGVMIAGPSTITALLNSLSVGFRAMAINEKAKEIREVLGAAKAQYEKFTEILAKAKSKIDEAGKTLEDAQKRNTQINKKLKSVEVLDVDSAEEILIEESNF